MIDNFEKAVELVREKFPDRAIPYGFNCKKVFLFTLSLDDKIILGDLASSSIIVDKKTEEVEVVSLKYIVNKIKKLSNPIAVDAPENYMKAIEAISKHGK